MEVGYGGEKISSYCKKKRPEEAGQEEGEKNSADEGREAEKERVYEAVERERGR